MILPLLLFCFFVTIMGVISLVGYVVFYRQKETASVGSAAEPARDILMDALLRVGSALRPQPVHKQSQLILAGYRQPNAAHILSGTKTAVGIGLGLVSGLVKLIQSGEPASALVVMMAAGGLGYLLPDRYVDYMVKRRALRLLFAIPTAIDLIVLSLEAGQSLDSAMAETARELRGTFPEMASELSQVQMEMLASRSRPEVFRNLRERNIEPEVRRLAQVFIDSDRFGTSLAPTLRTHVRYLRVRLRQQAQEKARKISVKLIFPVFFLIFPAVILVTLGPALIQIFTQLNSFSGL